MRLILSIRLARKLYGLITGLRRVGLKLGSRASDRGSIPNLSLLVTKLRSGSGFVRISYSWLAVDTNCTCNCPDWDISRIK